MTHPGHGTGPAGAKPGGARAPGLRGGTPSLVCRGCGAVAEARLAAGRRVCLESAPAGFAVDRAEITFWGLCPRCRRA
jgi:Fe2+ or Zn2+ uptake regulation protein